MSSQNHSRMLANVFVVSITSVTTIPSEIHVLLISINLNGLQCLCCLDSQMSSTQPVHLSKIHKNAKTLPPSLLRHLNVQICLLQTLWRYASMKANKHTMCVAHLQKMPKQHQVRRFAKIQMHFLASVYILLLIIL